MFHASPKWLMWGNLSLYNNKGGFQTGSLPLSCQLLMKNMANIFLLSGLRPWTSKLIVNSKQRHSRPSCCRILLLCPCPCPCPFPCHPWPCPCPCHSHHHRHSHHHSPCHTLRRLRRSHQAAAPAPQSCPPQPQSWPPAAPQSLPQPPQPMVVTKMGRKTQDLRDPQVPSKRKAEKLDVTMISVEFVFATFLWFISYSRNCWGFLWVPGSRQASQAAKNPMLIADFPRALRHSITA